MREKILFDDNWLFHEGDIENVNPKEKMYVYYQAKTERKVSGPASRFYKETLEDALGCAEMRFDRWDKVNLPHDYMITKYPSEDETGTTGYVKYDNAWYRKKFFLSEEDKDKRITLLFEGVATHATVYLNGCLLKHNFCGYTSFEVDISDVAKYNGEENVLAVYVEAKEHEGWWYEGAGIYRHVWLIKTDKVAVDLWGVYVAPKKTEGNKWQVKIETTVVNDKYEDVLAELETTFIDENDNEVAKVLSDLEIPLREKKTAVYFAEIEAPMLWDIDSPKLYTVRTLVKIKGELCDIYDTRTGFREFKLDANEGLFLNGKHVKLNGVCVHQDCGLTGKAVSDNLARYKIEMLKEMGANGYRTSHYPHSEATMDALDELGFIVMDETRWFESTKEGKEQLEMLMKRDRNRPSVLFWSLGNEEPHHITMEGRRIFKNLKAFANKLDDTRYIMTAVSNDPVNATVYEDSEVIGINYGLDTYEILHKKYPDKPIFASECCASGTTRGWYDADFPEGGYMYGYDRDMAPETGFKGRENTWKFLDKHKWIIGGYQWAGFEHRGETVWPRLCSQSGAIDLFLQKKDAFYQNQSLWIKDRPLVHLIPHWNFKGREGEKIRVCAYTNCEEVELYLNGKSMGVQKLEKHERGNWYVPYEPGKIYVEGRIGGKTVVYDEKETTDKAENLRLILENKVECANGVDTAVITCLCTDSKGREVPDASPFVTFSTNGLGKIIGTGSDICDHIPVNVPMRKMRAGRISVAVQVGTDKGELKIYASAENMTGSVLTINLN